MNINHFERPIGELQVSIHLRRGNNTKPRRPEEKKVLIGDIITAKEFLDGVKAVYPNTFENTNSTSTDSLPALLKTSFNDIVDTFSELSNLDSVNIMINGNRIFIHPDDISYVTIKVTGLFRELQNMPNK